MVVTREADRARTPVALELVSRSEHVVLADRVHLGNASPRLGLVDVAVAVGLAKEVRLTILELEEPGYLVQLRTDELALYLRAGAACGAERTHDVLVLGHTCEVDEPFDLLLREEMAALVRQVVERDRGQLAAVQTGVLSDEELSGLGGEPDHGAELGHAQGRTLGVGCVANALPLDRGVLANELRVELHGVLLERLNLSFLAGVLLGVVDIGIGFGLGLGLHSEALL